MLSPCPSVSPEHDDERGISYARPVGFDARHVLQRMQDIASMQQCVQKHSPSPATYAVRSAAHVDPSPGALDAMAAASRRIQQHIKEKAEATPRGPSRSPSVAGSGDHEGSGRPYVTAQALPSPRTQERAREALKALTKERRASQDTAAQRKEELFRQRDERLRQFTAVSGVLRPPSPSPSEQLKGATSIKVATIDLGRVLSESAGKQQQMLGNGIAKIITKPHRSGSLTPRLGHNNKENDARLR